jgi:hypothetical protein
MYKLINGTIGNSPCAVIRLSENSVIPFDPANTDYQAYLKWLADGNEPLAADEPVNDPS